MKLTRHLGANHIALSLKGESVAEILQELSQLICADTDSLSTDSLLKNLKEREELLSTAAGLGLAFPHCYEKVKEPVFALGLHRDGIPSDAPDGKPIQIFFIVISPENKPEIHLESLSAASRSFIDENVRNAVLEAKTAEDILMILKDKEQQETS